MVTCRSGPGACTQALDVAGLVGRPRCGLSLPACAQPGSSDRHPYLLPDWGCSLAPESTCLLQDVAPGSRAPAAPGPEAGRTGCLSSRHRQPLACTCCRPALFPGPAQPARHRGEPGARRPATIGHLLGAGSRHVMIGGTAGPPVARQPRPISHLLAPARGSTSDAQRNCILQCAPEYQLLTSPASWPS